MPRRALIVIDLQNDYFPGGKWTLVGIDVAAANARASSPRLAAPATSSSTSATRTPPRAPPLRPQHRRRQVHPPSIWCPARRSCSSTRSTLRDTHLKEILDRHDVRELVIAGAMSHMCIDAATRAAADHGYAVTLIHDACASRDLEFGGVRVRRPTSTPPSCPPSASPTRPSSPPTNSWPSAERPASRPRRSVTPSPAASRASPKLARRHARDGAGHRTLEELAELPQREREAAAKRSRTAPVSMSARASWNCWRPAQRGSRPDCTTFPGIFRRR
ncbi:isochorismatase family protein [Nannocystis pusilla]|uniref:isochorismatase family protein n=1 Tax=Nannocystis pusilla TaxID=889268 RepID=UPI003B835A48